jgi:hypothetical protein
MLLFQAIAVKNYISWLVEWLLPSKLAFKPHIAKGEKTTSQDSTPSKDFPVSQ